MFNADLFTFKQINSAPYDDQTQYTFLVAPKAPDSNTLPLGIAVLVEPSGYCFVSVGAFALNDYVQSCINQDGTLFATAYAVIPSAELDPFRTALREVKESAQGDATLLTYQPVE